MKQFIKYFFFGITTTLVNFLVFFVMKAAGVTATDLGLTITNALAWVIAVIYAYVTNKIWVFESKNIEKKFVIKEAMTFFAGRIFSGIFEILLPTPLTKLFKNGLTISLPGKEIFLDDQWVAKLLVCGLVILMNFIISKLIVFRNEK